ncbi:hypothetical protein GALMADRAFT_159195 [Galerina marginata CBS 339.88]|uniref:F-box domain-containing protein n=1 Tax=Galerina marginata (strain CBS 339.88) TaxID=685588 RepID=A0A067SP19_GALM3|nr:hypothetical protein GALMADRAFT_159195 [Galerina marginata CBS 339.88]
MVKRCCEKITTLKVTSMHRIFQIDEILSLIFNHFLPEFNANQSFVVTRNAFVAPIPDKATKLTLLYSALTCRSFSAPALNALWWALDDLQPLFSLLPGFMKEGEKTFTISGPILEDNCSIFLKYAMRIRFYNMTTKSNIHTSAYVKVLRATSRSCLLPSLNHLRCTIDSRLLLFLISPLLRSFCAEGPSFESWDIHTFIDELAPVAQNLNCLRLKMPLTDSVLKAISRAPSLEYLSLQGEDGHSFSITRIFESLSSSATLIYLHLAGALHIDDWSSPAPMLSFPNLRRIRLESEELLAIENITNFLRCIKLPRLAKFKCYPALTATTEAPKADNLPDLLNTLGQATDFALSEIDFGLYQVPYKSKVGPTIEDLPLLARFPLRYLRIPFLNSLSPDDITFMINSWPDLERLELESLRPYKLQVTFKEVVKIAEGLPSLRILRMECSVPGLQFINEVPVLKHEMRTLRLRLSPAELSLNEPTRQDDPIIFARCIDRIFPQLELPSCSFRVTSGLDTSKWKQIDLILSQLQGARNDQALCSR